MGKSLPEEGKENVPKTIECWEDVPKPLRDCIYRVVTESKQYYAIVYARVCDEAIREGVACENDGKHALCLQIHYILSNLQHWRGEMARNTKLELKDWLKKLGDQS